MIKVLGMVRDLRKVYLIFSIEYGNFFNEVASLYFINNVKVIRYFSKNGMTAVEVLCVLAIMADEKL